MAAPGACNFAKQLCRLVKYREDIPAGIVFQLDDADDGREWLIHIQGSAEMYGGLWFKAKVSLPAETYRSICVNFGEDARRAHPNVDSEGELCLDVLDRPMWLLPLAVSLQQVIEEPDYYHGYGLVSNAGDADFDALSARPDLNDSQLICSSATLEALGLPPDRGVDCS